MTKSASMSKSHNRTWLIVVWFFFFLASGAIILILYLRQWIEQDNFLAAFKQWSALYAPYIGAITLFFWGTAKKEDDSKTIASKGAFYLALVCSVIWNVVILLLLAHAFLWNGSIEESMKNMIEVAALLSWLVAGSIGYYFANKRPA